MVPVILEFMSEVISPGGDMQSTVINPEGPGPVIHVKRLEETPTFTIEDWRSTSPYGNGTAPTNETSGFEIIFTRLGVFDLHISTNQYRVDPWDLLFLPPQTECTFSHPTKQGDVCTVLTIEPELINQAMESDLINERELPLAGQPAFRLLDSRLHLQHRFLIERVLRSKDADPVEVESNVVSLIENCLSDKLARRENATHQLASDVHQRKRVDEVRALITEQYADKLTLKDFSRQVNLSPFHLCRVFKQIAGITLHQFLNRIRLRAALEQLLEGNQNLSQLALDVGFSSHSHFSDAFRREFSMSPSDVKREIALT